MTDRLYGIENRIENARASEKASATLAAQYIEKGQYRRAIDCLIEANGMHNYVAALETEQMVQRRNAK